LVISAIVFFAGFFIGYTLRLLDVIRGPAFGFEPIFPIHQETVYAMKSLGYEYGRAYGVNSEIEFLDVLRSNIVPAVSIVASGVLLTIPSVTLLFVIGIASGSSFAEILEFTPFLVNIKVIVVLGVFVSAMMFSASTAFHLGYSVYFFIKEKRLVIEKSFYDHFIVASCLVGVGIVLQYILLVM